jgi:protease PrsW
VTSEWITLAGYAAINLLPVPAFLAALRLLDSYKLVTLRRTASYIGVGCVVALVCWAINMAVFATLGQSTAYLRFGAPVLEEVLKAAYLVWLFRRNRIAFMVDAAISGFAIGAGFALVENATYLAEFAGSSPLLWIVRGFGTAMMHGANTAIVGILAATLAERRGANSALIYIPGLAIAIAVHSVYNQSLLSPVANAAALLILLPIALAAVFMQSENSLRKWLGDRLDNDADLLHAISSGQFSETHAGRYLKSLKSSFAPEIVGDMLCLVQLSLELSAQAKGDLLMREAGFLPPPDPELPSKLRELQFLERTIGPTGRRAVAPLVSRTSRDLWEMQMLNDST